MKKWLVLLVALVIIALMGLSLHSIDNYLLLQLDKTSIAVPLWLFLDGLIIVWVILHHIVKAIRFVRYIPAHISDRQQQKHEHWLVEALAAWTQEDYQLAAKLFHKLAKHQWHPGQANAMAERAERLVNKTASASESD